MVEIEITTKLLEDDSDDQDDPLYARYKQLRCDFTPVEVDSEEYSMEIRCSCGMVLGCAIELGSSLRVCESLLLKHLLLVTCLARAFTLLICFPSAQTIATLQTHLDLECCFCEVALGDMNELLYGDHNADNLPDGKLSTKGVGQMAPDLAESKITEDCVVVPLGKPKEDPSKRVAFNRKGRWTGSVTSRAQGRATAPMLRTLRLP